MGNAQRSAPAAAAARVSFVKVVVAKTIDSREGFTRVPRVRVNVADARGYVTESLGEEGKFRAVGNYSREY